MPIWIPLVMMALGTALQTRQQKKAGKRRTAELRIGRDKENKIEETQRKDVLDEAEQFDPALRQEAMDAKAAESETRINEVLEANELATSGDVGALPEALLAKRAKSTRDKANTASIMAALSSKVRAPKDASFDESQSMSELLAASQGRTHKLGRTGRTSSVLANLEGQTNPNAMMIAGLIQSMGMSAASGSIMQGLNSPGATPYAGKPQMTPLPNYTPPDAFGVAGIR